LFFLFGIYKQKHKRVKWTQEEHELLIKSLAKRGPKGVNKFGVHVELLTFKKKKKDLEAIAKDTNKTQAEVRAHLNAMRLEERRSNPLTPV
jgi:hypothetical protein